MLNYNNASMRARRTNKYNNTRFLHDIECHECQKKVMRFRLFGLLVLFLFSCFVMYGQELTVTLTSKHIKKDFYFDGNENVAYNTNNLGVMYVSEKGWTGAVYANSYYRPTVVVGKAFTLVSNNVIKLRPMVGVALTGYQSLGHWNNPAYVLPMYSMNITLVNHITFQANHSFVGVGLTLPL